MRTFLGRWQCAQSDCGDDITHVQRIKTFTCTLEYVQYIVWQLYLSSAVFKLKNEGHMLRGSVYMTESGTGE